VAIEPLGKPADWTDGAVTIAKLAGHLHCFTLDPDKHRVTAIWGTPRRAETIDVDSGRRAIADLLPETYQEGCPQTSPDGRGLLFTKSTKEGTQIFLAKFPNGQDGTAVVRGKSPVWFPNGHEFAFDVDTRHAASSKFPPRK
jgi:hypothetical protein